MTSSTVRLQSEGETLQADLYGELPARRAVVLVHGRNWDGSGWRDVAPLFAARGVPALALNLRGHDGSSGTTGNFHPGRPWSAVADLAAAKTFLRANGAREVSLVGASLGGHAVLASSFGGDIESVVSVSAPVVETADDLVRRVTGRKLFVCADEDALGAAPHVRRAFRAAGPEKALFMVAGREHSRGMFNAAYGGAVLGTIVEFVCPPA